MASIMRILTEADPAVRISLLDENGRYLATIIPHRMPNGGLNIDIQISDDDQTVDVIQFINGQSTKLSRTVSAHPITVYSRFVPIPNDDVQGEPTEQNGDAGQS